MRAAAALDPIAPAEDERPLPRRVVGALHRGRALGMAVSSSVQPAPGSNTQVSWMNTEVGRWFTTGPSLPPKTTMVLRPRRRCCGDPERRRRPSRGVNGIEPLTAEVAVEVQIELGRVLVGATSHHEGSEKQKTHGVFLQSPQRYNRPPTRLGRRGHRRC